MVYISSAGSGGNGEYSYLNNPYYEAYLSTFELSQESADIIFVGDSITLGGIWQEFFPNNKVLNRGIGSDTVEGIYQRISEVISRNPSKLFIMCGINDLGLGIPIQDSKDSFEKMIRYITENAPDCKVYIQSILPCGKVKNQDVEELNTWYKIIGEEYECTYIDLFSLFVNDSGEQRIEYFSSDKLHLNGCGYRMWVKGIEPFIR